MPFVSPILLTYVIFITFHFTLNASSSDGDTNSFTTRQVYAIMVILNLCRLPLTVFPLARAAITEGHASLMRIQAYLLQSELSSYAITDYADSPRNQSSNNVFAMRTIESDETEYDSRSHNTMSKYAKLDVGADDESKHASGTNDKGVELQAKMSDESVSIDKYSSNGEIKSENDQNDDDLDDVVVLIQNASFSYHEPGEEITPKSRKSSKSGNLVVDALYITYKQIATTLFPNVSYSSMKEDESASVDVSTASSVNSSVSKSTSANTVTNENGDNEEKSDAILHNVEFCVKNGELVAVIGSVGSGKSTLLLAIMRQLHKKFGHHEHKDNTIAYVGQNNWVQNKTLRDNILFDSAMDKEKYADVLDCSQLSQDLLSLPNADFTQIGENGITLSGML